MSEAAAALRAFNYAKQLHHEELRPTSISLPGVAQPIPCTGGTIRKSNTQAAIGGLIGDFAIAFRVRLELLPAVPEVGAILTHQGTPWRIDRVITKTLLVDAATSEPTVFLGCNVPSKR